MSESHESDGCKLRRARPFGGEKRHERCERARFGDGKLALCRGCQMPQCLGCILLRNDC